MVVIVQNVLLLQIIIIHLLLLLLLKKFLMFLLYLYNYKIKDNLINHIDNSLNHKDNTLISIIKDKLVKMILRLYYLHLLIFLNLDVVVILLL
ncbi:hypothetical protein GLOIN_2v1558775 [Rhizophagus irregularis DAOM 181602=DAOM 197198]|uniref:Uncharacterized protein n=1 Tax=Rhizophagus irregularis (strain DAOM 181602 / DAOM 197198 / MUCL 43194) TaxID=747089 RepID=A0A2P4QES3_RHIID|nr:hypothetical protein GLOIN_2v1558775 [Rhizophagus irregularis DAOM 181602=DAOM 197198]POG76141.1 hypothetical protein GLOIN_2v1558775 [Rhizophagus irregularis DAOM 181602=DAOM 197198]|eukprot:XP_025183007.1 hypothetical protein GLOIN_2v1558775 [Rhizophagus irregularis DAOM 181602=DAOM 197198]